MSGWKGRGELKTRKVMGDSHTKVKIKDAAPITNSRGRRNKQNQDGLIQCILEADVSKKRCQKGWARFIRLWQADSENLRGRPPGLPRVQRADADRSVHRREEQEIVKKILTHLGFYLVRSKAPPRGRRRKSYDRIAHTVKSRPSTTTCMQILNTRSMVVSPESKRG